MENYVVLPTRSGIRTESVADRVLNLKKLQDNKTLFRRCTATWITSLWRNMPGIRRAFYGYQKHQLQAGRLCLVESNRASLRACQRSMSSSIGKKGHNCPGLWMLGITIFLIVLLWRPWHYNPKAMSLKEAVSGVASDSLTSGSHYPIQPFPWSAEYKFLTYWWCATICPPEMNDVALEETLIIVMRIAAMRELKTNSMTLCEKPTLQMALEFAGDTIRTKKIQDEKMFFVLT